MWHGDFFFLLENLISKDFRVRYRNMSLGMLWSVANPLIMMGVLTVVFTRVFPNSGVQHYPLFVLCGLVPYNFFTVAWITGTTSVVDSASLVKRVILPREVVPISAVFSNFLHLLIQIALILAITLLSGLGMNLQWLWLPVVWAILLVFVCGLALITSTVNVYVRDTRYVVESSNTILFWLVPTFYSVSKVPVQFRTLYLCNPLAAVVSGLRDILVDGHPPGGMVLLRSAAVASVTFGAGLGLFRWLKADFYEHI